VLARNWFATRHAFAVYKEILMLGHKSAKLAAASLAMGLLLSSVAGASDERIAGSPLVETMTLNIAIEGFDLSTQRGARAAYRRIVSAAERICMAPLHERRGVRPVAQRRDAARCFEAAIDGAVSQARAIAGVDIEQLAGLDRHALARLTAAR